MEHEIKVPEVSEGVTAGTVVSISVAVGERVEDDQTLLELETDKAVVAIPSPFAGTIKEIRVAEGDTVAVGATIMVLAAADDAVTGGSPPAAPPVEAPQASMAATEADTARPVAAVAPPIREPSPKSMPEPVAAQVDLTSVRRDDLVAPAAPSVRRMARELGVDIYQVQGSGPAGRISAEDVRLFVHDTMQRITGGGPVPQALGQFPGLHAQRPLPDFSQWGAVSAEPLSRVRELTADAMGYAWSTIPMVTQFDKARITELEAFRKEHNGPLAETSKVTMTAILVKVCATALKVFPQFNSSLDLGRKQLILKQYLHIGVAVDTPNGLLVPVLRDVAQKGVEQLATELNELALKTRERKVAPAELEGGCFTISNLGGIGGNAFTPIVYAPQVAILGVSRAEMQPVWNGTEFAPQLVMPLALSYDHRVIDGADGARFLRWICAALEAPLELVMKG
jgi:pyruvate dehydrogenase E2 component (dihydrolipoamide acetyltransferase)